MGGVFAALASGLAEAPPGAWRGELIMTGAVLCMAFYNVWSRPFIQRSSAARVSHGGHGCRRSGAAARRRADRKLRGIEQLRREGVACGRLPRRGRRRARVHPVGAGARAGDADARRQHDDRQSGRRGAARDRARGRADHAQSDRGRDRGASPASGSRRPCRRPAAKPGDRSRAACKRDAAALRGLARPGSRSGRSRRGAGTIRWARCAARPRRRARRAAPASTRSRGLPPA